MIIFFQPIFIQCTVVVPLAEFVFECVFFLVLCFSPFSALTFCSFTLLHLLQFDLVTPHLSLSCGDFSGSSHTTDLQTGTPGTWHYRVSAGTGWPGVSIL